MQTFRLEHARALYLRFCAIYGDKFVKPYHDADFKIIWHNEWLSGLSDIDVNVIKGVLETCKKTIEWPPSIAEFLRLCEHASGFPSPDKALQGAIRRDFSHPIVAIAYDKIGNWSMQHDKENDLRPKFEEAYRIALQEFREKPEEGWKKLEEIKARPMQQLDYRHTPKEVSTFKANWANWKKEIKNIKQAAKAPHPIWDKKKITPRHPEFDQTACDERRTYFTGLT